MRPGEALRRAFTTQVSGGSLPSYGDLLERHGSNRGIAAAAGSSPGGSGDAALMRSLQRYGKAERGEGGEGRGLYGEQQAELARRVGWSADDAERLGLAEAVALMRERGMELFHLRAELHISKDKRIRDIPGGSGGGGVTVDPDLLTAPASELFNDDDAGDDSFLDLVERRQWSKAVELFCAAVIVQAYGMPASVEWGDTHALEIGPGR